MGKKPWIVLGVLLLTVAGTSAASRSAWIDPVTGVLKAHGYADKNGPGDLQITVPEDFALEPEHWRWDGSRWQPIVPPPTPRERRLTALRAHVQALLADPSIPQRLKDAIQGLLERVQ